jgi:probable HAF family extracellular repeat protein
MTDLGTLPGYCTSIASGISGNIVIGDAVTSGAQSNYEAFAYDLNTHTMTDLGTLGSIGSIALHVSGSTVVGHSGTASGKIHAFAYDLSTSGPMTDLGPAPGSDTSVPTGIAGNIVVGMSAFGGGGAFAYNLATSTMTSLGFSIATGISGNIISGYSGAHAVTYDLTTSTMTDLGNLGGNANCFNDLGGINGNIVVGDSRTATGACHAFAYDLSTHTMTDLGTLGGTNSVDADPFFTFGGQPFDGNTVVGDSNTTGGVVHAYAYSVATSGPMIDLGDLGAIGTGNSIIGPVTSSAAGESGDTVVGWARTADGQQHAFAYDLTTSNMTDLGTGEIFTHSLPNGSFGVRYSTTLTAASGTAQAARQLGARSERNAKSVHNTWKIISGGLPRGVHMNAKGHITGRPRARGKFTFTVRLINTSKTAATQLLSITVN